MTFTIRATRRVGTICCSVPALLFVFSVTVPLTAADLSQEVAQRESSGDLAGARSLLLDQAQNPGNSSAAEELAEFLDRHGDPGGREAYLNWAKEETDPARRQLALKRAVELDFINEKSGDLEADLERYRQAGGTDLRLPGKMAKSSLFSTVTIPGPLASFARMAALSPDLAPEELLPALARNVVTNGYEASGNEVLQQTEYLKLIVRYISQARELQAMAGPRHAIVIPTCDSEETGNLLKILGYRMRGSCGSDLVLETVNPTRAFLTVDSGFPLTNLEQDLRADHKFELSYAPTTVPVLYTADYWLSALGRAGQMDFIDAFISDPSLCRLYLGLSHIDRATAEALRKQLPAAKLRIYAHVLDFFGNMFQIRNGAAVTPGSPRAWASLVAASPSHPGAFFAKLIATDDGWMASYFDALSRVNGPTAEYLTQPERMKRFYEALRGKITSPGPARPVFRSSTELMLLTTSLKIDADGRVHVPGDLDVWRSLFIHHPHGKYDGKLTRSAASWRTNDDLVEALFGLSRKTVDNEPLRIFLALNDIDRDRAKPISADLASRLVNNYRKFGAQYVIFADEPRLSEASIGHYLDLCSQISSMHDILLKSDSLGTVQSLVELWRILCRQNSIPVEMRDAAFAKLIAPFNGVKQESELFNAGRSGVNTLLAAARVQESKSPQEAMTELLVGRMRNPEASEPQAPATMFARIFDAQNLIPLDALFTAADHLGKGGMPAKTVKAINDQLDRLDETQSARALLSPAEKSSFAVGYWSERHIDQERKLNLQGFQKGTEKKDVRAALAPFLRDTLVGMLYAYYAPSGAQLLLTNPIFVRSHDFIGPEGSPAEWRDTDVAGTGWPESSGGRLTGSLISLPYAIAEAEQNFLMPRREQALIWADLVPQMIVDVTVNRWRNVTPEQLRWVSLHLERGRSLLALAALDPAGQGPVTSALSRYITPERVESVMDHLRTDDFSFVMGQVPTSVLYAISMDPSLKNVLPDSTCAEISALERQGLPELTPAAISRAFGTPKPTLTHSYQPGLLYLRTFPALMGYSSRILAESWESNNLYYAAMAYQAGVPANQLEMYVPEWNRSAIENIFATHLEDWPAILRSLQTVAKSVQPYGTQMAAANATPN